MFELLRRGVPALVAVAALGALSGCTATTDTLGTD